MKWNGQNQNDICNEQSNTLILDKESSEESDEEKIKQIITSLPPI